MPKWSIELLAMSCEVPSRQAGETGQSDRQGTLGTGQVRNLRYLT